MFPLLPSVHIGPATVTYFSLIVIAAVAATAVFSAIRAHRAGVDSGIVVDTILWIILGSLISARIFYVFNPPPSTASFYGRQWYLAHPLDFQIGPLAFWSGGLGAAGAVLGGLLVGAWHLSRLQDSPWMWADIFAPALLLGLAIIPWANVANQQLYGPPTSLPWGISIADPIAPYTIGDRFHPTPVYVSLWTLSCLLFISLLEHRSSRKPGILFLATVSSYLTGLFLADWVRLDVNHSLLGLTGTQWLALFLLSLCAVQMRRFHVSKTPPIDLKINAK